MPAGFLWVELTFAPPHPPVYWCLSQLLGSVPHLGWEGGSPAIDQASFSHRKCERTTCQDIAECQTSPARITHYQLNFQTGLLVPAHIFRIGPAPAFAGDTISLTITKGNEEGYFVTRRLNPYTGVVSLQRSVLEPRDFALDVEMKLWRQGSVTTFLAKMYIFFTTVAP